MGITSFLYNKKSLYWTAQILGWGVYMFLVYLTNTNMSDKDGWVLLLFLLYLLSILETHAFRFVILKFNWLRFKPIKILILALVSCLLLGFIDEAIDMILGDWVLNENSFKDFDTRRYLISTVLSTIFFVMWSAIYFAFHFVGKAREEEIKNLQLEASKTEIELKNLKSQLNPHFMFNSMNSIRALIDENPDQAKFAITQLSSILRNTLLMGKNKIVSIRDEMNVVKDYLSLEHMRYEERLSVEYHINEDLLRCEIPPMMIQTIVENGIKHGISKLAHGGILDIGIDEIDDKIHVVVSNSGALDHAEPETGIGLRNTIERLQLLYGDAATFSISQNGDKVVTHFTYPKKQTNESIGY